MKRSARGYPLFIQYEGLFEKNPEMGRALELYYCDILEFHYHALQFLGRPGKFSQVLFSQSNNFDELKDGKGFSTLLGRHSKRNFGVSWTA